MDDIISNEEKISIEEAINKILDTPIENIA